LKKINDMNYDYNNMETEKSKNFPYGTESVFVLNKQDILYYQAMPYEDKTGKHCQIKIYLRGGDVIRTYLNNSSEVKEAMDILRSLDSTVFIARAKTKNDKSFQRDFITTNRKLYGEAIDNL
jgi:hypothetical protein